MRKIIVPVVAAISLATFASPAFAERETRSIEVSYADLDVTTPAGMASLERRIKAAVRTICGTAEVRNLRTSTDQRRCAREANDSANVQLAQLTGRLQLASR